MHCLDARGQLTCLIHEEIRCISKLQVDIYRRPSKYAGVDGVDEGGKGGMAEGSIDDAGFGR